MNAARILRNNKGFSLIELMVVVAIIGILAMIAIPNFNRFQAKAKQSEAKSALAALHAAEKAFFAEWNSYYGDFRDIGYLPEGRLNYHLGFAAVGTTPGNPFVASTAGGAGAGSCFKTDVATPSQCGFTFQTVPQIPTFTAVTAAACGQAAVTTTPSTTAFTATAMGKVSDSALNDVWSINEAKILCNNTPGI
jgi:type IV pilus assembly protein PilA